MVRRITSDAVVVGAGPAGSTAAALLAERGHRVVVLEKQQFPRYHVGESLIPFCYFPLQRIGMIKKMRASAFTRKYAVQFVLQDGTVARPFYFDRHLDHDAAMTWQVVRSQFDQMLLDNAREKGAEIVQPAEARDLIRDGDRFQGVVARDAAGDDLEVHAKVTIDATGRSGLAMTRCGWQRWDRTFEKAAIWTYYRAAMRDTGRDAGSTTVAYLPEKAWFWYIPLPDDVVSVGIVGDRDYLFRADRDMAATFNREIAKNAWIEQHLATGRQFGKFYATKEFSYRSEHSAADGLVLVGDAFTFLDPVFSSGVYLALRSGECAADAADRALQRGDVSAAQFVDYAERMQREVEAMRKLVYAFYDTNFSFGKLIKAYPSLRNDLTNCLIGNLNKEFSELFAAVAQLATVPAPLPFGGATAVRQ
jgi:flavin-dependent dehydrogenase